MKGFNPKKQLQEFLAEDIGSGDITSALLTKRVISARIISREDGAVLAGVSWAKEIFKSNRCKVRILKRDGSQVKADQVIMTISGNAKNVLECERTALNLLARMSGIATLTNQLIKKIPKTTALYATRKTAPGLRYFDKKAVEIGGGNRHRLRLDEMVMIKDNHIAVEGSMESLVEKAKKRYKKFEVEVESIADAVVAAQKGATIIMLDNFSPAQIKETIKVLREKRLRDKVMLEASGGINYRNIARYAQTEVDIISVGSITNSVKGIDMSLEI